MIIFAFYAAIFHFTFMKTILLFIYHYAHMSDLLQTEWIREASKHMRVVVVTPKRKDEIPLERFASPNVVYKNYSVQNTHALHRFKLLRVSTVRKFDFMTIMQYSYKLFFGDERRKFLRAISRPFSFFLKPEFYTFWETKLLSSSPAFDALVEEFSPALIATCTPGLTLFEAEAIVLAKRKGIKTASINFSWDNLSSNALHVRKPDYLICWNDIIKKEAIDWHGYTPQQLFSVGILRFDHYFQDEEQFLSREEFLRFKELDPSKKTVLIATVPATTFPHQKEIVSHIVSLKENKSLGYDFNILVRVHPIDRYDLYSEFEGRDGIHIERAGKPRISDTMHGHKIEMTKNDLLNLKATLRYCDVNVNFASTLTLESAIFDQPIVNVGLGVYNEAYDWTHYKPVVDTGGVRVARTLEEIGPLIDMYLKDRAHDRKGRKEIVARWVQSTDGLAYRRSVEALRKIVGG